jgi:hypothetical protein
MTKTAVERLRNDPMQQQQTLDAVICVRLRPHHLETLRALAEQEDRPTSNMARQLLIKAMRDQEPRREEVPVS